MDLTQRVGLTRKQLPEREIIVYLALEEEVGEELIFSSSSIFLLISSSFSPHFSPLDCVF